MLLKQVSKAPLLLYTICTAPVPIDAETYLGTVTNLPKCNLQYLYIAMSHDSPVPLTESQLYLCAHMGVVYFCEMQIC